jgi:uncharacterized membrane protein
MAELAGVVGVLAGIGLGISIYFSLAFYGVIRSHERLLPAAVCSTKEARCLAVLGLPDARVFGVPNSLLGNLYYLALLGLLGLGPGWRVLWGLAVAGAWLAFLFGLYLIYALVFRIRTACPLCLVSHAINTGLAAVLTYGLVAGR